MSGLNWRQARDRDEVSREISRERITRLSTQRKPDAKPAPVVGLTILWPNGNTHTLEYDGQRTRGAVRRWLTKFSLQPTSVTILVSGRAISTFPVAGLATNPTQSPIDPLCGSGGQPMKSSLTNRELGALGRRAGTRKDSPATIATTSRAI